MHKRATFVDAPAGAGAELRGLRGLGLLAGLFALALPLLAATDAPALRPYEVLLYGTVRAIDPPARSITIAYAPLDTAAGGTRAMRVLDPEMLAGLRRGDPVRAIADTRRTPWTVRDISRMP